MMSWSGEMAALICIMAPVMIVVVCGLTLGMICHFDMRELVGDEPAEEARDEKRK